MPVFAQFKKYIEEFEREVQDLDAKRDVYLPVPGRNLYFNHTRTELGRKLYLLTRHFLDANKNELTAEEKGAVFQEYVDAWRTGKCLLDIADTEFAEAYKKASFGKYGGSYNECCPMTAGFDLSGARLTGFYSDMVFAHVNFNQADFTDLTWVYMHFENCLMNQIQTSQKTNLNQSKFIKCAMNSNNLTQADLCEASLTQCSIIDTQVPKRVWLWECTDTAPYPQFLRQLKISSKKLTPETIANALWLADKGSENTKASKSQFAMWAKKQTLAFTLDDVEEYLTDKYVMKK
jgi:hypothetical protein